jgi:hypothetical protein
MENAKQILKNLENESSSLKRNLESAMEAGDSKEIIRLKQRQKDLPNEIFSARVLAVKGELTELEAQQVSYQRSAIEARQESKAFDVTAAAEIEFHRKEITRLNNLSFERIYAVKSAENILDLTRKEIGNKQQKLAELLSEN